MRTIPVLILVALLAPAAAGADYYVTQAGAGTRSGAAPANAWALADFNASGAPRGGDRVHLAGTFTGTVAPSGDGGGAGAQRLTIDCTGATLAAPGTRLALGGRSHLDVVGGTLAPAASGTAITFSGESAAHDVTVRGWQQSNGDTSTAAFVWIDSGDGLVIADNRLENTGQLVGGYHATTHDIAIRGNLATTSHDTTEQTDLIFLGDATDVLIEGNKLVQRADGATSGRHNDIIQCFHSGSASSADPSGWVLRYNWLELDVRGGSGDTSWLMLENLAERPGVDACKVYGNVFLGDVGDAGSNNGVNFNSSTPGAVIRFHHNTVIRRNGPYGTLRFLGPGATLYAEDNVGLATNPFSGRDLEWTDARGVWDYNWFHGFDATTAVITGPHGSTADPLLTNQAANDFSPSPGSPLRGAGDPSLGAEYASGLAPGATWPDPALVARATTWDVGAYQSAGGGGTNQPPTVALTAPTAGARFLVATTIALAAQAADDHGVTRVEFYDGATLIGSDASPPYALSWSGAALGAHALSAKAYAAAGASATSAAVAITVVAAPPPPPPPVTAISLWDAAAAPAHPADADASAVEVGVKFRSDVAGTITAIRFYKGAGNSGAHVGHLWSRSGAPLGAATFTGEAAGGWQQADFAAPIAIAAGTTYVASYHTDAGHYAGDNGFFAGHGVDRGPLQALADGVDGGDGVYRYGAGGFPDQSWQASNYWVDVIFVPAAGAALDGQWFELVAEHSGKCLDVAGVSASDGARVHQWSDWHGPNQQWRFAAQGDGSYTLVSRHSGKALDLVAASTADGAAIQQWTLHGGPNQRWRVDDTGGGWYRVLGVGSGKALTVAGASGADGAPIVQQSDRGAREQRWALVAVAPSGDG